MGKTMQTRARTAAAVRKGFKPADLAVFGALVIAALLVAVGIAHSGSETVAVKTDRMTVAAPLMPAEEMVTISDTDTASRTTTLTRMPKDPSFGYGL